MADARTVHHVLLDMENAQVDIQRLSEAVQIVGRDLVGRDPIGFSHGEVMRVLGEVIGERASHLTDLLDEGLKLGGRGAYG